MSERDLMLGYCFYTLIWVGGNLAVFGYAVFVAGASGWWFLMFIFNLIGMWKPARWRYLWSPTCPEKFYGNSETHQ